MLAVEPPTGPGPAAPDVPGFHPKRRGGGQRRHPQNEIGEGSRLGPTTAGPVGGDGRSGRVLPRDDPRIGDFRNTESEGRHDNRTDLLNGLPLSGAAFAFLDAESGGEEE